MNVLFVSTTRYSQPLVATLEKKFRALSALGQMHVIGFSDDTKPRRFNQYAQFYLLPCLPIPALRYLLTFSLGPALALWCVLRHRIDVLVAQGPYEGFAAAWAKIVARSVGRKVALVVESHGDFEVAVFMQRQVRWPGLYRSLMRHAARFGLHHADALRPVSGSARRQLESLGVDKPIQQFVAWTDIEAFREAGAVRGSGGAEKLILYVGVLIPRKGIHLLLDAFATIRREREDIKLCLIGAPENPTYTSELHEQVRRLGLHGCVRFLDAMPQAQLATYMAQARVMVLPSFSEGLPRVIYEAFACGTPVVGTAVSGIPEIIQDGETGFLVPPGDVEALTDRLRWILTHPQAAAEMGSKARGFAHAFFSPESYVRDYARVFEKGVQHANTR